MRTQDQHACDEGYKKYRVKSRVRLCGMDICSFQSPNTEAQRRPEQTGKISKKKLDSMWVFKDGQAFKAKNNGDDIPAEAVVRV